MPPHHSLRKYQGPGVWAHVKADYLAGELGRVVAERYDVSLANLRRRASTEGWTRAAHAQAVDRPPPGAASAAAPPPLPTASDRPPPAELDANAALEAALVQARRQLAAGRGAEAAATLKAAEALRRLQAELDAAPDEAGPDPDAWEEAAPVNINRLPAEVRVAGLEGLRAELEARADTLARALLTADAAMTTPAIHTPFVLHWRALHLGPEAAAADHATAVRGGWAARAYHPDGRLRPLSDLLARERRGFACGQDLDAALPPLDDTPAWLDPI